MDPRAHDRRAGVLVVGSVNVDFVARVARLPRPGETVTGGDLAQLDGGKGGNQAVAAARLGAHVVLVAAVGRDELADRAVLALEADGVDVSAIARLEGPTGVALIVVDDAGENQIAVASGANALLDGALTDARLSAVTAAHGAVVLANLEVGDEALLAASRHAHRKGLRLVINPAPARPLPDEVLALGPLLVPNLGEAYQLTGQAGPEAAARALVAVTHAPVIVTLGGDGALVDDGRSPYRVPTLNVNVVDATGAGDAFCGALAVALAEDSDLGTAARFAVAAAGISVTRPGARGGMPRRHEVQAALEG